MPLLFSYGTLQRHDVQQSTFGRLLQSSSDALVGFELGVLTITAPAFIAESGKADHAIVRFTGNPDDRVTGMVLEVTDAELAQADAYEPDGYVRVLTTLASGRRAWVYADGRFVKGLDHSAARK